MSTNSEVETAEPDFLHCCAWAGELAAELGITDYVRIMAIVEALSDMYIRGVKKGGAIAVEEVERYWSDLQESIRKEPVH